MNTRYIIHVQLAGSPSAATYGDLHDRMERFGARRTIADDHGYRVNLPNSTYLLTTSYDAEALRDAVLSIAQMVNFNPQVLVVELTNAAWHLEQAAPGRLAA